MDFLLNLMPLDPFKCRTLGPSRVDTLAYYMQDRSNQSEPKAERNDSTPGSIVPQFVQEQVSLRGLGRNGLET